MLYHELESNHLQARKNGDKTVSLLLGTLLAELQTLNKRKPQGTLITDQDVIQVLKTFIGNTEFTLTHAPDNEVAKAELLELQKYLPIQLTDQELRLRVKEFFDSQEQKSPKIIGVIIAGLTTEYPGQFDSKKASGFIKELLT